MIELLLLFGIAATLAAVLANVGIWSPRKLWVKLSAVLAAALFLPVAYGAFSELLSRPKPVGIEWAQRAVPLAIVLSSRIIEDKAIYLWLAFDGLQEPRAYALPWSENLARQLHDAQRHAEAEGRSVMMRQPFEQNLDQMERVFYPEPHAAPPPKQVTQGKAPMVFHGIDDGRFSPGQRALSSSRTAPNSIGEGPP